ncbi:reverse transcriptase domain-containing protein [Tanacetum coccineum]|uniref:Reverse transcriptase domain-containing protein n=1 Tax=Tanacetum coccineum TaxID=301880 RepID=A0ABQ5BED8_9ASTR
MRPFPSLRGNKYILMAIDYLSKWVEAKVLPTNDARVVCKFLKSLFARFGTPRAIIVDPRQPFFCQYQFAKVMLKYGVTHRLSTAYHPQNSGQELSIPNRSLKRILERTVGENRASCFDLSTAGDHRKVQLNELNELCDQAYENSLIYKEKTKRIHDSKIKNRVFNIGDQVLLFNSRLMNFSGKLKSRWSGPFTVTQVYPYGTVELSQTDRPNFKVNGHRLKHYFGGDVPQMVVPDPPNFSKTKEFRNGSNANDLNKCSGRQPMLILVVDCSDFEASRARGFVLRSQELQILSFIWEIQYPNLID